MGNHLERALEVGEEVPHVVDGPEGDREGDEEDEVQGELPQAHEEVDKVPEQIITMYSVMFDVSVKSTNSI